LGLGSSGLSEVDFGKLGVLVPYNAAGFVIQPEAVSYAVGGLASADCLIVARSRHGDGVVGLVAGPEHVQCVLAVFPGQSHCFVASVAEALDLVSPALPRNRPSDLLKT
jgi:hypothetical protein